MNEQIGTLPQNVDKANFVLAVNKLIREYNSGLSLTERVNELIEANATEHRIAFRARRVAAVSTAATTTLAMVFETEDYDYGSCYSTSTGLFTAPVDGIYLFTTSMFLENTTSPGRAFFAPRGTADSKYQTRSIDIESSGTHRISATYSFKMIKGQTFGMGFWTSTAQPVQNPAETFFTGHLVFEVPEAV